MVKKVISIHALREESDSAYLGSKIYLLRFQSTLSVRRATLSEANFFAIVILISIHALREESDIVLQRNGGMYMKISIHALREESDIPKQIERRGAQISIHALREESDNYDDMEIQERIKISIHALREESD